jgi:hypothetical protein
MDLPQKNAMHVAQDSTSKLDVEVQPVGTVHEVKRDLERRHINMIAIAGMIVSLEIIDRPVHISNHLTRFRALGCS